MENLKKAIDRIKILECPTGELENRVKDILEGYNIANRNEISINRDEKLDTVEEVAYSTKFSNNRKQMVILAKSGLDDYVTKVINVYIPENKQKIGGFRNGQ